MDPRSAMHILSAVVLAMSLPSKTVCVVGSGTVGATLANVLHASIAARDPARTSAKLAEQSLQHLKVEALKSAVAAADIVILATPSFHSDQAIEKVAKSLGDVSGKIIIDATNPLTEFEDGLEIRWKQGTSGGEVLQKCLPSSKVYKAFNTLGVEHMAKAEGKDMLFCGPEEEKSVVSELIAAVGFRPYYVGPIRYSRNLEAIAELWIHCAIPPLPGNYLGRDWTFGIAGNPEK